MKNKILSILLYIFTFLFLIYPTSYGISDLKVVFTFVALLLLVLLLYKKVKIFQKININKKFYPWIILILATITRIGIVLIFESHITQLSTFGGAFSASNTLNFSDDFHLIYTHWILYPTIIHGIYQIFGSSQLVALLTSAVILIVASILVYKVSSLLFKNKTAGFVSALLYIFWPSNILYTLIFTQEHICLLLLLIVLYLFLIIENKEDLKLSIKNVILLLLIGICLGLSTFFKNFAPAFIIAFIIYYFLRGFTEKNIKKYTLIKLGTIVIILIGFVATKNLVFIGIDHLAGHTVARNITPCYLNVGLNKKGVYDAVIYGEYENAVRENNYDYDKANDEIMDLLKKRLSDKDASIWQEDFFDNKANIIFGNDSAKISWVVDSINATGTMQITNFIENDYNDWNNYYFIILVTLMTLGLISMNKNKDLKKFLLYLVLFGSLLLLLLVEAQNRYMYAVQPIICILATGGLFDLIKYWEVKNEKIPKTNKSEALD